MNLHTQYMTRNDCFTAGKTIIPQGIMIHSTATPGVMAGDWFTRWNKSYKAGEINRQVCTHAFVDDKGVWQYLPWNHRGWHCGGTGNDKYISVECCEPKGLKYNSGGYALVDYDPAKYNDYFTSMYNNLLELFVMLSKQFGVSYILDHAEGARLGQASNHADTAHWFPYHGKTMDVVRADFMMALEPPTPEPPKKLYKVLIGPLRLKAGAKEIERNIRAVYAYAFMRDMGGGEYTVQVFASGSRERAQEIVKDVEFRGYSAFIKEE